MVDQTAPAAAESHQQNGGPAASTAPRASPVPPVSAGSADAQPAAALPWSYPTPEEPTGSSRSKSLGGLGVALLLAVGIGGLIFARRRRRSSRREQAMDAAMSAVATVGSIGVVARIRRGVARVIAGRAALEAAADQNAKRASRIAKQARKKMPS